VSIPVGLGQSAVIRADAGEHLVAHGLGSCIAICLFDPISRVAGLAHVVLPGSDPANRPNARFAGTALPALLEALWAIGGASDPRRYHARVVGGAHVLGLEGGDRLPRIGEQNVHAVKVVLTSADVPILGEHVGGSYGRTVWFDPQDGGRIRVRNIGGGEVEV